MAKRLTYTKADIIAKARAVPYATLPYDLLNDDQRLARDKGTKEFDAMVAVYESETGRKLV